MRLIKNPLVYFFFCVNTDSGSSTKSSDMIDEVQDGFSAVEPSIHLFSKTAQVSNSSPQRSVPISGLELGPSCCAPRALLHHHAAQQTDTYSPFLLNKKIQIKR